MCDNITIFVGGLTTMLCYFLSLNTKITLLTKYMNFRFRMNDKFVRKLMKHNRELKRLIDSLNVPLDVPLDVPSEPLNVPLKKSDSKNSIDSIEYLVA